MDFFLCVVITKQQSEWSSTESETEEQLFPRRSSRLSQSQSVDYPSSSDESANAETNKRKSLKAELTGLCQSTLLNRKTINTIFRSFI